MIINENSKSIQNLFVHNIPIITKHIVVHVLMQQFILPYLA